MKKIKKYSINSFERGKYYLRKHKETEIVFEHIGQKHDLLKVRIIGVKNNNSYNTFCSYGQYYSHIGRAFNLYLYGDFYEITEEEIYGWLI